MHEDAIIEFINSELLQGSGGKPVERDTELILSGLLNSLAVMRLVGEIEKQRGIRIPETGMVLENFQSVSAITSYLDSLNDA